MTGPRSIAPLDRERLRTLTTPRLLAYRDRLLGLEASLHGSDWDATDIARADPTRIYFKDDARWIALEAVLRAELATREHVRGK